MALVQWKCYLAGEVNIMSDIEVSGFIKSLIKYGLSKQQIKTLRGQAFAGDLAGAKKGLERLIRKKV